MLTIWETIQLWHLLKMVSNPVACLAILLSGHTLSYIKLPSSIHHRSSWLKLCFSSDY